MTFIYFQLRTFCFELLVSRFISAFPCFLFIRFKCRVMIVLLRPKPSVSSLLGFSLITATSGILSWNPDPKYVAFFHWVKYILPWNPMCKVISGHEPKRIHRCGVVKIFQMSVLISGYLKSLICHLNVLEKIPACKMWLLSSSKLGSLTFSPLWMSKLLGAFHHWNNKNGPFFFPQTEEYDWHS